jgi:hypothetical protein
MSKLRDLHPEIWQKLHARYKNTMPKEGDFAAKKPSRVFIKDDEHPDEEKDNIIEPMRVPWDQVDYLC